MVKASDFVGGGSAAVFEEATAVSNDNEWVDVYTFPLISDPEVKYYEIFAGGYKREQMFTASIRRFGTALLNGVYYTDILEGVLDAGSTTNEGFQFVTIAGDRGQQIGDAADPLVEGRNEIITIPGSGNWVCPAGVTSVCVVCIGAGGGGSDGRGDDVGGGGGALAWKNNIPVTPGQSYAFTVGAAGAFEVAGGDTTIFGVTAGGGGAALSSDSVAALGGTFSGADGGGNGGAGADSSSRPGGGGGAGGYSGAGGKGGKGNDNNASVNAAAPVGGGSGGGSGGSSSQDSYRGGGTHLFGEGASGGWTQRAIGGDGSPEYGPTGYGAGQPGNDTPGGYNDPETGGAIRIIWGDGRAFPNTGTAQLTVTAENYIAATEPVCKLQGRGHNNIVTPLSVRVREVGAK